LLKHLKVENIIASKRTNYLEIKLIKEAKVFILKWQNIAKKENERRHEWKDTPSAWTGRFNIINVSPPKYRCCQHDANNGRALKKLLGQRHPSLINRITDHTQGASHSVPLDCSSAVWWNSKKPLLNAGMLILDLPTSRMWEIIFFSFLFGGSGVWI
jgi:hypothetical protein